MSEFDPLDLMEVRIRGEYADLVGLLALIAVEIVDEIDPDSVDAYDRRALVVNDLIDQTTNEVNFGEAERQLKRMARQDDPPEYRGVDVRIHEFDPRHPDVESELDVNNVALEEARAYGLVALGDDELHMAGYPDSIDMDDGLQLATALRMYAREIEDLFELKDD